MHKDGKTIQIESFELSPRNEAVIGTLGRLKRNSPGPTLATDLDTFNEPGFIDTIASTIAKMSEQSVAGTKSKVRKAGQEHDEDRDTTHPKTITELFMSFLRPLCIAIENSQIQKNTREEVMWLDARSPWRRSPLWLFTRVVLQLVFRRLSLGGEASDLYKQYMVVFMSTIIEDSCRTAPSEHVHMMNAKVARRLLKLGITYDSPWFPFVQRALHRASDTVNQCWQRVMSQNGLQHDMLPLKSLDFGQDTLHALPDLDKFVKKIHGVEDWDSQVKVEFTPQSSLVHYQPTDLPDHVKLTNSDYNAHNLVAFETWVALHLDGWIKSHIDEDATCSRLSALIRNYYNVASPLYSGNPEAISIMFLTIVELWIACDRSATHIHGILGDYDACIPEGVFQSLLLPFRSQMGRLARVERYLHQRQQSLKYTGYGVFRDFGTRTCFSVRYFEQSDDHHRLKAEIEAKASSERMEKQNELWQKHERYNDLMNSAAQIDCEYYYVTPDPRFDFQWRRHNDSSCQRCGYKNAAKAITIDVHEWPLPTDDLQSKSTVFELNVPSPFGCWRDTTSFFLHDVLQMDVSQATPRAKNTLSTYRGLSPYFIPLKEGLRIGLLSEDKPHERTHRRTRDIINVTEEDVCLNNGLHWKYYDHVLGYFITRLSGTHVTANSCTYKLPQRSSSLQQFLFRPADNCDGPSPNTVIASQSSSPMDMSLAEFKALCTIPLGVHIQWQNVLLQLAMSSVDFKKVETSIFIIQVVNQAGPPNGSSDLRTAHGILDDDEFARTMLDQIRDASERFQGNWEFVHGLCALIFLTVRILSLSSSSEVQDLCLNHLSHLRNVAVEWANQITDKANCTDDDKHRNALLAQSVHIALACVETFDCEDIFLDRILANSPDAATYIRCCMVINDRKHVLSIKSDPMFPILLHRWRRLTYRCYPILAENIIHHGCSALDTAIKDAWAAYCGSPGWETALDEDKTWLVSWIGSGSASHGGLQVHLNLLTGELLVNGLPLARLPSEYERHETYNRLFGRSLLEVMPSDVRRMQFSCQKEHMGHTVHLGKERIPNSKGYDLLVQATKGDRTYEFVPPRLLVGLFPDAFVEDYVHWYDQDGGYVEFRPAEEPWVSSDSNWRLHKIAAQDIWQLSKEGLHLINVESPTVKLLSQFLEPIEKSFTVHCIFNPVSSALHIDIPRLRLEFSLQSGCSSIQSRQYRGMSIDADQSLETLVGLQNKLVLVHETSKDRLVLVPEGTVSWDRDGDHVAVNIGWQSDSRVHAFSIDRQRGRLADNGSLQSKLHLCFLHALTSFCLPDPLTQRTGTEEALSILRSGSVRSFDQLQPENCDILGKIAALTPKRCYYPENERVMQSVYWCHDLGYLAQHGDFYLEVVEILQQNHRMRIFHPDTSVRHPSLPHIEADLLKRELIRSSAFRVSGFGAEDHTLECDQHYSSLDRNHNSSSCSDIYILCRMVYDEILCVRNDSFNGLASCLWGFLRKYGTIRGPDVSFNDEALAYDAGLILEPTKLVPKYWCSTHRILSSRSPRFNRFRVMMWLATLAFSEKIDMFVLEALASLYVAPIECSLDLLSDKSFLLGEGDDMRKDIIRPLLLPAALEQTPESDLHPMPHEDYSAFERRKEVTKDSNRDKALNNFLSHLHKEWPTHEPHLPSSWDSPKFPDYFDTQKVMDPVCKQFGIWYDNKEFRWYINEVASVLSRYPAQPVIMQPISSPYDHEPVLQRQRFVCIDDLLGPLPDIDTIPPRLCNVLGSLSSPRILDFVEELGRQSKSKYEKGYVEQLQSSIKSLQKVKQMEHVTIDARTLEKTISSYQTDCESYSQHLYAIVSRMLLSGGTTEPGVEETPFHQKIISLLSRIGHFPRVSPTLLLSQLSRHRWHRLPKQWKNALITYGCSLTVLQQAKRLPNLIGHHDDLIRELQNPGHTNWDPHEFPESLLLEIENGILIRDVQEGIAQQMRNLSPGENAVMQLNMGEGKSSVIVPIVAAALANKSCLIRVLVAKPQSRQMFQMLVSKLGGLLDRRVYHMPISRSLKFSINEARELERMCRECMSDGGVLLVQPEHILSLKLMCLECYIADKIPVAECLLRTLELFKTSSRDIVDESDENFSVKFELVYTVGIQRPLELSPQRWTVIQQLLDLVRLYAPGIKKEFPRSIEVDQQPGRFPRIRLLHSDAGQALSERIAKHICDAGFDFLPVSRQQKSTRDAVFSYFVESTLTAHQIASVEKGPEGFFSDSIQGPLFLMRGMLAGGVLNFCFGQKRWRVNYGPHFTRVPPTKLAVPYRAKDCPAQRSEFSHPDVVIVLTCLSYYYAGLCDEDLFLAFNHLVKSDQADIEYQSWIRDAPDLSPKYRNVNGINLEDRHHCVKHIFPDLRFSKGAIDYFLSHIVYSKELKEFPDKLSASGWDIGEIKAHPTVGFSGTNDSRNTLPLDVKQLDLPEQNHTNALVLEYLLRDENTVTFIPPHDENPSVSGAQLLLNMVTSLEPATQVILEVGAQIIELSNFEVAKHWLEMIPNNGRIHAVVFVNESDEICVLDRNGRVEPLQTSPFSKQLEACHVFLDEAHTRGIDLKLPVNYRAAVTLGPGITKDKLVQGKFRKQHP